MAATEMVLTTRTPVMIAKCSCYHCSGHMEFDAVNMGREIECPHCGMPTKLYVPNVRAVNSTGKSTHIWIVLVLVILAVAASAISAPDAFVVIGSSIGTICLLLLGLFLYFLPSYVGRKKRNATAIFALNFLAGWTFIGWVVAMVWACMVDSEKH
jgi:hypothetical protein